MTEYLYGTDIDEEFLHADEHEALEHRVEWLDPDHLPLTGRLYRYTIRAPGLSGDAEIPDGATIAALVVERFNEECGFEDLAENYDAAAEMPDVVAAFGAARDLLVSKQRFRIADRLDAKASYTITAIDENGVATYTIGEWEPA